MMLDHVPDRRVACPRRQKFFPTRSFSAALSRTCSASSFFSRRFSSSSTLRRLASDTSSPPYLDFQLYNVGALIPCRRHRSATRAPASCSLTIPMIWLSLNRLLRMLHSPQMDSTITWRDFRGAGQEGKSLVDSLWN